MQIYSKHFKFDVKNWHISNYLILIFSKYLPVFEINILIYLLVYYLPTTSRKRDSSEQKACWFYWFLEGQNLEQCWILKSYSISMCWMKACKYYENTFKLLKFCLHQEKKLFYECNFCSNWTIKSVFYHIVNLTNS